MITPVGGLSTAINSCVHDITSRSVCKSSSERPRLKARVLNLPIADLNLSAAATNKFCSSINSLLSSSLPRKRKLDDDGSKDGRASRLKLSQLEPLRTLTKVVLGQ